MYSLQELYNITKHHVDALNLNITMNNNLNITYQTRIMLLMYGLEYGDIHLDRARSNSYASNIDSVIANPTDVDYLNQLLVNLIAIKPNDTDRLISIIPVNKMTTSSQSTKAFFDTIKELDQHATRMLSSMLLLHSNDQSYIIKRDNNILVFINESRSTTTYEEKLVRIISMIPAMLGLDISQAELPLSNLIKHYAKQDIESFERVLNPIANTFKERLKSIEQKKAVDGIRSLKILEKESLVRQWENTMTIIDSLQRDITNRYTDLARINRSIAGLESSVGDSVYDEFIDYLLNFKKDYFTEIKRGMAAHILIIKTRVLLKYWDMDDASTVLQRERVSGKKAAYKILKAVLLDQTYDLYMSVTINIDFKKNRVTRHNKDKTRTEAAQPHILGYNCWGDNAANITKMLSNVKLIEALELIYAALESLNIADGPPYRFLKNDLLERASTILMYPKDTSKEPITVKQFLEEVEDETQQD